MYGGDFFFFIIIKIRNATFYSRGKQKQNKIIEGMTKKRKISNMISKFTIVMI